MPLRRVVWQGTDEWRAEEAEIDLRRDGLAANGTQIAVLPAPYRLDYRLDAPAEWVTRSLEVEVRGDGWTRSLALARGEGGAWSVDATATGRAPVPLAEPGGDAQALNAAVDCDLGRSPLTNTLPVRRLDLLEIPDEHRIVAAWVAVPALEVLPSSQRYAHVRREDAGAVVRFASDHFTAALRLDRDGLVIDYPGLARRASRTPATSSGSL
jgi:hypothetical protein